MITLSIDHAKHIVRLRHKDAYFVDAVIGCGIFTKFDDEGRRVLLGQGDTEDAAWQHAALRILADPEFWLDDERVVRSAWRGAWLSAFNEKVAYRICGDENGTEAGQLGADFSLEEAWRAARQHSTVRNFEHQYREIRCLHSEPDTWTCSLPKGHEGDHIAYELNDPTKRILDVFPNRSRPTPLPVEVSGDSGLEGGKSDGAKLIAAERARQINREGCTTLHDDGHTNGEMAAAASAYVLLACDMLHPEGPELSEAQLDRLDKAWPWSVEWWKPSPDPIRNLVKAGALIAAEIDRLQRLAAKGSRNAAPEKEGGM